MHAYRRFVQETMDLKRMRAADVERAGGPSRQVISKVLTDPRPTLDRRPDQATVEAFAKGLDVRPEAVLAAVAEAMGLPVHVSVAGLQEATDDQLLAEVRRRMRTDHHDEHNRPDQHQDRERAQHDTGGEDAAPAGRRGTGRRDAGPRQKTSAAGQAPARSLNPADYDLAAHPPMELTRDRQDREWGDVGEENQDHDIEGGA